MDTLPSFSISQYGPGNLIIIVQYDASFDVVSDLPAVKEALKLAYDELARTHPSGFVVAIIHDTHDLHFSFQEVRYGLLSGFELTFGDNDGVHTFLVTRNAFIRRSLKALSALTASFGIRLMVSHTLEEALALAEDRVNRGRSTSNPPENTK